VPAGRFSLRDLPPEIAAALGPAARLTFPRQGQTSDVALAEQRGRTVVVKRCAHRVYIDWLRRERVVLKALAGTELPIPSLLAYADTEAKGVLVVWLVMTRLAGEPLFDAVLRASERRRITLLRRLGELLRRLHSMPVPAALRDPRDWTSRQLVQARANLDWCDGTAAGLAELERSRPVAVPEALIHGDLALDNVLVDADGRLYLIDWAGGGPGDPRHDIALALQTKPETDLTPRELDAFHAGYASAPVPETTRDWFVRLYDYF